MGSPTGLPIEHYDGAAVAAYPGRWPRTYEDIYAEALELSDHSNPPISHRSMPRAQNPGFALGPRRAAMTWTDSSTGTRCRTTQA
jgi:hypothetical protein